MYDPTDLFEAARSIRPLLPKLLEAEAIPVDQQLADLLNQSTTGERTIAAAILDLLQSKPPTQAWLEDFLRDPQRGSYQPLPGMPALQPATKYVCPIGNDYTWFREGSEPVRLCETHLVPLVPAQF
jgi:hypothetical protein